ncbi:MAG: hypothetical protein ACFFDM_08425, partial [Candidatus Thorarchaeota archaeon]
MERAKDPVLINEAERILREYSTELSLESISIFRKDGVFLYSSDPLIHPEEYEEPFFTVLLDIVNNFVVGVPFSVILHDWANCLILKPIYLENWGEVEGWYLALGSCFDMNCRELVADLRDHMVRNVRSDISRTLGTEDRKRLLELAFDFPKIIGREFEKDADSVLAIEGDYGVVVQRYDSQPQGVSVQTFKPFPPLLQRLDDMDQYLQSSEAWGILYPDPRPHGGKKPTFIRSNRLLKILLAYSFLMMIAAIVADPGSFFEYIGAFVMVNLFLLFFVFEHKRGGIKNERICPCFLYLVGIIIVVIVLSAWAASGFP